MTAVATDYMGRPVGKPRRFPPAAASKDDEPVPEGSIADVREWVGYDPERAKAALVREHAADRPRTGLLEALERIVKEA